MSIIYQRKVFCVSCYEDEKILVLANDIISAIQIWKKSITDKQEPKTVKELVNYSGVIWDDALGTEVLGEE
jgi:hypothetical protein